MQETGHDRVPRNAVGKCKDRGAACVRRTPEGGDCHRFHDIEQARHRPDEEDRACRAAPEDPAHGQFVAAGLLDVQRQHQEEPFGDAREQRSRVEEREDLHAMASFIASCRLFLPYR